MLLLSSISGFYERLAARSSRTCLEDPSVSKTVRLEDRCFAEIDPRTARLEQHIGQLVDASPRSTGLVRPNEFLDASIAPAEMGGPR